jgi:hypothetical protein
MPLRCALLKQRRRSIPNGQSRLLAGNRAGLLLNLDRHSIETLELAWIVRKKRMSSTR